MIYYTNLDQDSTAGYNCFNCHFGTAYEVFNSFMLRDSGLDYSYNMSE